MEQLTVTIPHSFIAERVRLTWREVRFGIEEGIFAPPEVIDLASDLLAEGDDSPGVLDLASTSHDEPVLHVVTSLADSEAKQDLVDIRQVWAFLVLAWIFEHRDQYQDPLDLAEKVYADFDYPEQVAPLIRYMPSDDPELGSPELNEKRLFEKWEAYLRAEAKHFAFRSGP